MAMVEVKEQCRKCFHFSVCASVLKDELYIREVMLGEEHPKCKMFIEIVPCKECKHYKPRNQSVYWNETTPCCHRSAALKFPADGFCSYGERKDNEI